jgi:hypothetical protein
MHEAVVDPWYSNPTFVVPVLWIIFLSGILWASQPWNRDKTASHDESAH